MCNSPSESTTAAISCTARRGRSATRASGTSATGASTSARTMPSGSTTTSAAVIPSWSRTRRASTTNLTVRRTGRCSDGLRRAPHLRRGGVTHHQAWLEEHVGPFAPVAVESFDDRLDHALSLLPRLLADGRQVDVGQLREHAVVVACDGDLTGNVDAGPQQLI